MTTEMALPTPPDGIRASRVGAALRVVLDKPGRHNAIDGPMLEFLGEVITAALASPSVRSLTLTGVGDFCAGADIAWISANVNDAAGWGAWLDLLTSTIRRLDECPLPVLVGVPGFAIGGGLELLLAGDVVVATPEARLGDGHVRHSFVPGGGSSFRLERRVSAASARYLLLTGRLLDVHDAQRRGLVDDVVAADQLEATLTGYEEGFSAVEWPLLPRLKQLQARREQGWPGAGWAFERALVEAALAEGSARGAIDRFAGTGG